MISPFLRGGWRVLVFSLCWCGLAAAAAEQLAKSFANPPDSARPGVYWYFMDGNLSREGMTRDLEAMKAAGLGHLVFLEVNVGVPRGPVAFLSEQWQNLFAHAVREAERLGIEITLGSGPGWTGSGGPWVKPEQSMQHLVAAQVEVQGPAKFAQTLLVPPPRRPFFGDVPKQMRPQWEAFFKDVAVLAFPTPESAATLPDSDEKALVYRAPFSSQPGVKPWLEALAEYPAAPAGSAIPADKIIDLTSRLRPDGSLDWQVPAGKWTVMRFVSRNNGASTRPAPEPGIGFECDKFDAAALDAHFDEYVAKLLKKVGPRQPGAGWTMLHIDSWEMGAQNWTPRLREEFRRRRGYDPLPYYPAFVGRIVGSRELTERFLWDLRLTGQELVVENHAEHLKKLGRKYGFKLSIEPYDMNPANDFDLGAVADVPMCEFWSVGFNTAFSCQQASSIAHIMGCPVVAAEAFTGAPGENWKLYPGALKNQGDWAFGVGVNRFTYHTFAHKPDESRPGMVMGPYGVHWDRGQTWWPLAGAYHRYITRCQQILRQGRTVADILYLMPEGAPNVFQPPASACAGDSRLPDRRGYNFDGCSSQTLVKLAKVRAGQIVFPSGAAYRILVLPDFATMTPELLSKLESLVKAGATIVGNPPRKSPSLVNFPACDREVARQVGAIWGVSNPTSEAETGARPPRAQFSAPSRKTPATGNGAEAGNASWAKDAGREGASSNARGGRAPQTPASGLNPPAEQTARAFGEGRVIWGGALSSTNAGASSAIMDAQWIWYPAGEPAQSAAVGTVWFRREFTVPAGRTLASASLEMTADNDFVASLNGKVIGEGHNFHEVKTLLTRAIRPGVNVLSVRAENGGSSPNPAGLLGALRLEFTGGPPEIIPTDGRWTASQTGASNEVWVAAKVLGAAKIAPWNLTQPRTTPVLYPNYELTAAILRGDGVAEDFVSPGPVRYTHRSTEDREIYFVANRSEQPVQTTGAFRAAEGAPELWDPITGQIRALPQFTRANGVTTIPLRFDAFESYFVVFPTKPASIAAAPGKIASNFASPVPISTLDGAWDVAFDPAMGAPAQARFDRLEDWTVRAEPGLRHYSGIAKYRKSFDLPPSVAGNRQAPIYLDLGEVRVMAQVWVNGQDCGVAWTAPWRVDITAAVRAGSNDLEIAVANLWPNRMIGDAAAPEKAISRTTYRPYKAGDALLPSGLLGPVRLMK